MRTTITSLVAISLILAACSGGKPENQRPALKEPDAGSDDGSGDSEGSDAENNDSGSGKKTEKKTKPRGSGSGSSGGSGSKAKVDDAQLVEPDADAADVFTTWCEGAAKSGIDGGDVAALYSAFCKDGAPTALLSKELIAKAYDGTGEPQTIQLAPISSDAAAKTTSVYVGIAIKLPISAQQHFEKVGPRGGDAASLNKLVAAQSATGSSTVLETLESDAEGFVRGWKIRSATEKKVVIVTIKTDYTYKSEQYMFAEGKAYGYVQYDTQAVEGFRNFDLLAAAIEVDGSSYLIGQAMVTADNLGFASQAESSVPQQLNGLVKAMYKAAEEAK